LPSITQATAGIGLVGACGATKAAPSGLSAAVTRSAENGISMGAPACRGPDVGTGARVEGVDGTVVVVAVVVGGTVVG
jgi:hypothetical protein